MDEIMIVTGLVGALVASSYKWGYFVFATVALFFIAWNVTWVGRKRKFCLSLCNYSSLTFQSQTLEHLVEPLAELTLCVAHGPSSSGSSTQSPGAFPRVAM